MIYHSFNLVLISFSFLAGLSAFFAPCSIALIPAYIGYYVKQNKVNAFEAGICASLGLISVYILFGIIFSLFGRIIAPVFPWIEFSTGGILIFMGSSVILGFEFATRPIITFRNEANGLKRFYLFGIAYAFGSIGCTLPIFLLVIFQSFAQGGVIGGLINFSMYTLAMSGLMIVFSFVSSLSKNTIHKFLTKYMVIIQKSSGILVLIAGIYLVYLALQVILI